MFPAVCARFLTKNNRELKHPIREFESPYQRSKSRLGLRPLQVVDRGNGHKQLNLSAALQRLSRVIPARWTLNVRVWTPHGKQEVFERYLRKIRCCRVSGLLMQPCTRLRACMEIADRVPTAFARSRRLDVHWFSRPRLLTVAPYLF